MPHIIYGVDTKKELKEVVESLNAGMLKETFVFFVDPAILAEWKGWEGKLEDMPAGTSITCTNHPKRSWFATVEKVSDSPDKWAVS